MNSSLRDRILRKLDELPDERGYQLLDYVEFLESKFAGKTAVAPGVFERFAEGVEDTLRAGKVSASTIAETMGLLNKAMNVLGGVAETGKTIANDAMDSMRLTAERRVPPAPPPAAPAPPAEPEKPRLKSAKK
jgi:hypothetical protein